MFENNAVSADSVEDFLDRYYKPQRFRGRGEEYAQALIASHQADFDRYGYDIISHHDSVTGRVVAWFGDEELPIQYDAEKVARLENRLALHQLECNRCWQGLHCAEKQRFQVAIEALKTEWKRDGVKPALPVGQEALAQEVSRITEALQARMSIPDSEEAS